jgi:4-amino-4-deoxy-L-arabinose transferase-like glycosyltransferase
VRARLPYILLALIVVVSFGLHAYRAAHPTTSYQSADERAYGRLALNLAERQRYGAPTASVANTLHWPPGAPFLFGAAHEIAPSAGSDRTNDIPAAYWAQALVSTGTTAAAFLLALLLAGPWAGVVAAALVGFYPPLILATGEQLSEPLGAFFLTCAFLALAWATTKGRWWTYALAGALFGLTALTRADLVLAGFMVAALVGAWAWRQRTFRRGLAIAALIAGGVAVTVAPWVAYASARAGHFVPITQGSASALFVGTYLPGNGTTVGMKRALAAEVKKRKPALAGRGAMDIDATEYLALIAARHPGMARDDAVSREARHNIAHYVKTDPIGFAGMMANKVQRMWTRYARGGARHTSWEIRTWHILLVLGGLAGLSLGLWRTRSAVLAAILLVVLYSTALHTLVVSQARYNLPLMPALIAGGVAGWFCFVRLRAPRAEPSARSRTRISPPAPDPERPASQAPA